MLRGKQLFGNKKSAEDSEAHREYTYETVMIFDKSEISLERDVISAIKKRPSARLAHLTALTPRTVLMVFETKNPLPEDGA